MKKWVAICAVLAALVWAGAAGADVPHGSLTGLGVVVSGVTPFEFDPTVVDGGTSYVGASNDLSGNCNGDSGNVTVNGLLFTVVCAHYVAHSLCCNAGSAKMRFAYGTGPYNLIRITDNGLNESAPTDTFAAALGGATTLAQATAWVNTGAFGSGHSGGWTFMTVQSGDYAVNP